MSENNNNILVISSSFKFFDTLSSIEQISNNYSLTFASDSDDANLKLMTADYSVIIINTPLADSFGLDLAIRQATEFPSGVMIFVNNDLYNKVKSKADPYGIITMPKQISAASVCQAISLLSVTAVQLRYYKKQTDELKDELEELKVINRAKLLLMEHFGMTEKEAHQYIHKRAMDTKTTKRDIAVKIINSYAG